MNTPICDFVSRYAERDPLRLHMPGHKGVGREENRLDLTEIDGADSLYEASGIIRESEQNAGELFGADTFYSTEGSSLCIRAMLFLASIHAKEQGKRAHILAGRNAHKTFLSGVALLDLDVTWLTPSGEVGYLSCPVTAEAAECAIEKSHPTALYLTSPDYLGNTVDVGAIAKVCKKHGVLLLVDNAHGAYLKFLESSLHPIDLGADLCCDSAHKTLPVLTGGAYLHVSKSAPKGLAAEAKRAMSLFGSTSPSYLILQSLDAANRYLSDGYSQKLAAFSHALDALKSRLVANGYTLVGSEPLKLTIAAKSYGYTGKELAELLSGQSIECEFADPDHLVLMLTPDLGEGALHRIEAALCAIPQKAPLPTPPPHLCATKAVLSVRQAMLAPSESLPVAQSVGRILASASVGCPPAVPIAVCGEAITKEAIEAFRYYGIDHVSVVK